MTFVMLFNTVRLPCSLMTQVLSTFDFSLYSIKNCINSDLENFYIWLCANRISLNVAKVLLFRNTHKAVKYNIYNKDCDIIYINQSLLCIIFLSSNYACQTWGQINNCKM